MKKLTLISLLIASMSTTVSADMGFGGIMKDMMDIPKDIITEGTDAVKDMKDSAKDSATEIKDNIKSNKVEESKEKKD